MFARNHKTSLAFLSIFLISVLSPSYGLAVSGMENVDHLLESLLREDYHVSYEAEEVVIFFSNAETEIERYKVGKLKPHNMRREKYNLDGTLEEVLVHDDELQIISYPERKIAIRTPLARSTRSADSKKENIELIKKNYDIMFENSDVVAGRKTIVILIRPKESGTRPAFRVWFDSETGLVMKTEAYSSDGALSYLSSLRNVSINPAFPPDYFVIMVPEGTVAYEPAWLAVKIDSPGFVKKQWDYSDSLAGGYILKEVMEDDKGQLQLVYYDGLNNISVFSEQWSNERTEMLINTESGAVKSVEKVKINGFEGLFCRRGAENIMSFISGNHRLTLVGAVSKEGLVNIARDLKKRSLKK